MYGDSYDSPRYLFPTFSGEWHRTSEDPPPVGEKVLGLWQYFDSINGTMLPVVRITIRRMGLEELADAERHLLEAEEYEDEHSCFMAAEYHCASGMTTDENCKPSLILGDYGRPLFWAEMTVTPNRSWLDPSDN